MQKDVKMLEAIQRRFTRLIAGMKNVPYEERLRKLHLQSLECRRKKRDLVQAFIIWTGVDKIEGLSFTKISEQHNKNTRSATKDNFVQPHARLDQRKHFFAVRVVPEWNKLPLKLQRAVNVYSFKAQLKNHIF